MAELPSPIIKLLIAVAEAAPIPVGTRLYLFGSVTRDPRPHGDIDVFLIYPDGALDLAHALATDLRALDVVLPIEVLAMSETEERISDFIAGQRAQLVWECQPDTSTPSSPCE